MTSKLFFRKLSVLDYQGADTFDPSDETQVRNLVVWLEDQKIRHYKIEDRAGIRNGEWGPALSLYLKDVGCPVSSENTNAYIDWLLGFAVRLEYGDNVDKYRSVTASSSAAAGAKKTGNPLDSLDFESADFKAGIASLTTLLQLPPHHDYQTVTQAVCLLITEKFSKDSIEWATKKSKDPKASNDSAKIPIDKIDLGFDTGDYISAEAAKILRLLHIRDLRNLQTRINQAIVHVQSITANPKTDSKLGKVGRM